MKEGEKGLKKEKDVEGKGKGLLKGVRKGVHVRFSSLLRSRPGV